MGRGLMDLLVQPDPEPDNFVCVGPVLVLACACLVLVSPILVLLGVCLVLVLLGVCLIFVLLGVDASIVTSPAYIIE